MFSESSAPLPWDENCAYTRDAVELYYQVCVRIFKYPRKFRSISIQNWTFKKCYRTLAFYDLYLNNFCYYQYIFSLLVEALLCHLQFWIKIIVG